MQLLYEDFEVGQKFVTEKRSIRNEDILKFAELSGDFNKLHLDREFATESGYDGIIAHGLLTLSITLGLWHSLDLTNRTVLAFAGLSNVSFRAPVYPEDLISVVFKV